MAAAIAPALKKLLALPEAERKIGSCRLMRQLGRGGFAPVWLAEEVYGNAKLRTAAVKLFAIDARNAAPGAGDRLARVIEEARLLCQVEHPNIVRFYSLLVDEPRGIVGLAMEYVAGVTLAERLEQAKLQVIETLSVGVALASALAAVHRAGLVHRDVKPANVVEAAGVYKLIDFGIASALGSGAAAGAPATKVRRVVFDDLPFAAVGTKMAELSTGFTVFGEGGAKPSTSPELTGTTGYIDPACARERVAATASSDLYGLGVLLFECLTGKLPAAVAMKEGKGLRGEVLDGRAPAPRLLDVEPKVPVALARIVDRLLEPDRAKRPRSAENVAIELERIKRELSGRKRSLPSEDTGPFRGLGRFEEAHRDVFFGRGAEVAAALEMLRTRGLVALVGPSGSGKSSLARAGVLPAMADGGLGGWPSEWRSVIASPGVDPRGAIAAALAPIVPDAAKLRPQAVLEALVERVHVERRGLVLLVDQLEEIVTLGRGESQQWAVDLIARIGEQPLPGVRVLVASRRDLLDGILAQDLLGRTMLRGTLLVAPMSDATWGEVLDAALESYGYAFEDAALRDELLAQLGGTAAGMPLVQFALTQLWQERDRGKKLVTRLGLAAIGGIAGALERHAEATFARLLGASVTAEHTAREVLLALTTPQGTRATVAFEALAELGVPHVVRTVVDQLEVARLLTRDGNDYALAHEALLSQWGRLRTWVAEAREDRVLAGEVDQDAERWSAQRDEALLWKKRRLVAGEDLRKRGRVKLSARAEAFLRAGRIAERRGRLVAGGLVFAVILVIAGVTVRYQLDLTQQITKTRSALEDSEQQRKRAEDAERKATSLMQQAEKAQRDTEAAKMAYKDDLERLKGEINGATMQQLKKLQEQVRTKIAEAPAPQPAQAAQEKAPPPQQAKPLEPEQRGDKGIGVVDLPP